MMKTVRGLFLCQFAIIVILASVQGCKKIDLNDDDEIIGIPYDNVDDESSSNQVTQIRGVPVLIENSQVHEYINGVQYNSFSNSQVKVYAVDCGYRMDHPTGYLLNPSTYVDLNDNCIISVRNIDNPIDSFIKSVKTTGDDICISNLTPGCDYLVDVYNSDNSLLCHRDTISAYGQVRMLFSDNAWNVRDIGGLHCFDGRTLRYGRIFRGGAYTKVTDDDLSLIRDLLCIKTEIDLRSREELKLDDADISNNKDYSVFGDFVDYYHCALPLSNYLYESDTFADVFMVTLESLRNDKPVYIHCAGGADRTGAVMMLFEALLGVVDSDIAKDYELTSFAPLYYDKNNYRICTRCETVFAAFADGVTGKTNQIIAKRFLQSHGITEQDIIDFLRLMII